MIKKKRTPSKPNYYSLDLTKAIKQSTILSIVLCLVLTVASMLDFNKLWAFGYKDTYSILSINYNSILMFALSIVLYLMLSLTLKFFVYAIGSKSRFEIPDEVEVSLVYTVISLAILLLFYNMNVFELMKTVLSK